MQYKELITETLDRIQSLFTNDSEEWKELKELSEQVKTISDERILFHLYQNLRELIARELSGDEGKKPSTEIEVKMPDGKIRVFEDLKSAQEELKKWITP